MGSMKVYFDNAATTPMRKEVIELMNQSMTTTYGNPSSTQVLVDRQKQLLKRLEKL